VEALIELEFCSFWAMQKECLPGKRAKKITISFPARAAGALTFFLIKSKQKSLTAALDDLSNFIR